MLFRSLHGVVDAHLLLHAGDVEGENQHLLALRQLNGRLVFGRFETGVLVTQVDRVNGLGILTKIKKGIIFSAKLKNFKRFPTGISLRDRLKTNKPTPADKYNLCPKKKKMKASRYWNQAS